MTFLWRPWPTGQRCAEFVPSAWAGTRIRVMACGDDLLGEGLSYVLTGTIDSIL
jgi:hypothetical protein